MAKLKQKNWMTVTDAARYLTGIAQGEPVTEADILQYVLDDELTISIRINSWPKDQRCLAGDLTPMAEALLDSAKAEVISNPDNNVNFFNYRGISYAVSYKYKSALWPGTYDLAADEITKEAIAALWLNLLAEPNKAESTVPAKPAIAKTDKGETQAEKCITLVAASEDESFMVNAELIPANSYFIFRKTDIDRLLVQPDMSPGNDTNAAINDRTTADPNLVNSLHPRTEKSYLQVIKVLCQSNRDLELTHHSTCANQITAMADSLGLPVPSKRSLENLLKKARDSES
ncbi:hypothetical protein [Marinobacter nauticus]|uniref:hypothetical protein n=1 Tax=Marinobacter nauticus TaxID=2743 RepID=UPI0040447DB6